MSGECPEGRLKPRDKYWGQAEWLMPDNWGSLGCGERGGAKGSYEEVALASWTLKDTTLGINLKCKEGVALHQYSLLDVSLKIGITLKDQMES